MSVSFQVEIENTRYVPFVAAKRNAAGSVTVTPMLPDQTRALVRIAAVRQSRVSPLHVFDVRDLPVRTSRPVAMNLTGKVLGFTRLRLRLHADGTPAGEATVPVTRYVLAPILIRALLVLLLLSALAGSAYWYIAASGRTPARVGQTPPVVQALPDERTPPAEPPALPAEPAPSVEPAAPVEQAAPVEPTTPVPQAPPADEVPLSEEAPSPTHTDPADEPPPEADPGIPVTETTTWTIYFNPESAELTPAGRSVVSEAVEVLLQTDTIVDIEGHTAQAGTADGRAQLSLRRAEVVAEALTSEGLSPQRIGEVQGFSARYTVSSTVDEQHLDRRTEIIELTQIDADSED